MGKKEKLNAQLDDMADAFTQRVTRFVSATMQYTNLNKTTIADKLGVSQAHISGLMAGNPGRYWNLKMLLRLASLFDVSLSILIGEIERFEEGTIPTIFYCADTEPASKERLQALILAAVQYKPEEDVRGTTRQAYDVTLVAILCPEFYQDYLNGKISDSKVFTIAQQADAFFRSEKSGPEVLYGHAIAWEYTGNRTKLK